MPRARLAEPDAGPECYRLGRALSAASATDPFVEGAAAVVLGFSFLGFFASRFPRCSRCAMTDPFDVKDVSASYTTPRHHTWA